jgi:hypothetical protein
MANAAFDENHVPTLITVSAVNGTTIDRVQVNASNHGIKVSDAATGTDHGPTNAAHDSNHVPTLLAVSSVDGVTPVVVYSDGSGVLLVQST